MKYTMKVRVTDVRKGKPMQIPEEEFDQAPALDLTPDEALDELVEQAQDLKRVLDETS